MDFAFLDTNSLIKLYIPEIGSGWLKNYVLGKQIVFSELTIIESLSVIRRLYLEGKFTLVEASDLFDLILHDKVNFRLVPIVGDSQVIRLSQLMFSLPINLRIRALDSIQLISAEIARDAANAVNVPVVFVSSDAQLLRVAQNRGFITENPENYP